MNTIFNRLYSDYVMPSRLDEYERFVLEAMDAGYLQTSVRSFYKFLIRCKDMDERIIVHRHDIDTDLRTAKKIFEIEKKYNIRSTYYFRITTLDFAFMREIEEYGSEASYHYEEIASFAKRNHIKDASEILNHLSVIRHEFLNNFSAIEKRLGRKLTTVASHGDFSNRRLKLANHEILKDRELRERCGIECESYDQVLLNGFDIYISDRPYPHYYHPVSPFYAIRRYNKICFLTHPRQWETNWIGHTKDNFLRLYEGLKW
jgi:hypothetical protein